MRWIERRKAGLTFMSVVQAARECKQEGLIDAEMDSGAMAAAVAAQWAGNLEVEDPNLDWDAIIAFIEQLLPLILRLIELFS